MNHEEAKQFINRTYNIAFHRLPSERELAIYSPLLRESKMSPSQFLELCVSTREYKHLNSVSSIFPMGHFHSPVVNPSLVHEYIDKRRSLSVADLKGIEIDIDAMGDLWAKHLEFTKLHPFRAEPSESDRFRYGDGPFPEGDALSLQLILAEFRPKRIVEIGSGFSTACILDCADRLRLEELNITCIEPYPARLRSLLRPSDHIQLIEKPVQNVESTLIDELEANDIFFVDSTHVMKTGSDVHFEFFDLLPRLKSGVIVHFHDVQFPFEYPGKWIFELNYSWNEAYALRAFLMYNNAFKILYWNSLLCRDTRIKSQFPLKSGNPGSSIWLKRI